ncbi:hypothetical protein OIU84_007054 [Salix udensis]|uniref:Uncharacterized protein n=1 Tax=Salix udensis TaxID=889485 RepID=A0AAD6P2S8_9ROSI|nr:hypothetical protein OIU84_007054 [Salix udensis]
MKTSQSSIPSDEKSPIQSACILMITTIIFLNQLALGIQLHIAINEGIWGPMQKSEIMSIYSTKWRWFRKRFPTCKLYIDKGRSILRFFFLANRTCFVIFMHKSNSIVMHTKMNASRVCLKYKETAEKTRNAMITSSHITNTTTSILQENTGQREETRSGSMPYLR